MTENLQLAARVHYAYLPDDYADDRLEIAVCMQPLHTLGGDYCSILPLEKNRFLVCICDAVGHDTSAALFAARINTYVLTHAQKCRLPCELIDGLNAYLCKRLAGTGMYATFYALLFDFESGTMSLAGAAHPPVLQLSDGQDSCKEWESNTTLLGIDDPLPVSCVSEQLAIKSGDRFLLYSDGLIEVEDRTARGFGTAGLSRAFLAHRSLRGQEQISAILTQAESYAAEGFADDILLMSVRLK